MKTKEEIVANWLPRYTKRNLEYYVILAMNDFLKGMGWLKRIDAGKYHKKLQKAKSCRVKNAICWRLVEHRAKKKFMVHKNNGSG